MNTQGLRALRALVGLFSFVMVLVAPSRAEAACQFGPDQCKPGFVWRAAFPNDHACVSGTTRARAATDNARAVQRRVKPGSPNPETCLPGYVWREAGPNDNVCVRRTTRAKTAADNRQIAVRRDPSCSAGLPAASGNVPLPMSACPFGADQCKPGFVWREAYANDHVCVTGTTRQQAGLDNLKAKERKAPDSDACVQGFVWRESSSSDRICVSGSERGQAAADNSQAAARRDPVCAGAQQTMDPVPGPVSAPPVVNACTFGLNQCKSGFVWRDAFAGDQVCVSDAGRRQAAEDNAQSLLRKVPPGSPNPDACLQGFVWREASANDRICVTGIAREQAAADNAAAAERRDPACALSAPPVGSPPDIQPPIQPPLGQSPGTIPPFLPPPGTPPPVVPPPVTPPPVIPPPGTPAPVPPPVVLPSAPSPVTALSGYLRLTSTYTFVAPLTSGSSAAQCPAGTVIAGGWPLKTSSTSRVISAIPLPDGSGFDVMVNNPDPFPPLRELVSAQGVCINRPAGYEIVQATRNLASRERGTAEARCPAGKVLLGGGAKGTHQTYLASTAPSADGSAWTGFFRSLWIVPSNEAVQAFAICASAAAVPGWRLDSSPDTVLGPGGQTALMRDCRPQKHLSVGWFSRDSLVMQGQILDHSSDGDWPFKIYGLVNNGSSIFDNSSVTVSFKGICAAAN